nr:hypothetical protein [Actinomadura oligospora]
MRYHVYVREALYPRGDVPEQQSSRPVPPLGLIGELDTLTSFQAISRLNDVGSWSIEVPSGSEQSRWLLPGRGIVVFRDGRAEPVFSGPIRSIERAWDAAENPGAGVVRVTGVDDMALLAERLAWTNPAEDIHWAAKHVHWQTSPSWTNVGELLRELLLANVAGQPDRWVSKLYVARQDPALLDDETANSTLLRFNDVSNEIRKMAAVYGFRISCVWHPSPYSLGDGADADDGPGVLVRIQAVDDLTGDVQFGAHLGNLQAYSYSVTAPEATRVVVGAQRRQYKVLKVQPTKDSTGKVTGYTETEVEREGPERYYAYYKLRDLDPDWWGDPQLTPDDRANTLAWANRGLTAAEVEWGVSAEKFVDASSVDWQWMQDPKRAAGWPLDPPVWSRQYRQLHEQADKVLVEAGPSATITVTPVETPSTPAWADDYDLGDIVRVHLDGDVRDEVVREVELIASVQDGHLARPTLGTEDATASPLLYRQIKGLWTRVNDLAEREDLVPLDEPVPVPSFGFTRVEEAAA